mmetsp:Transcript_23769/g.21124  ORF Transcript_23769/g.21124 Transcript_23769/m.21124 type:complete len:179 (-) Transcript_23769:1109-1645(-)
MMVMYFVFPDNMYDSVEMVFPVLTIVTRSMVIAIRYAYMSDTRYSVMKSRQTFDYLKLDLILLSWQNLKFSALTHEIKASRSRIEYEEEDFYFDFLDPISEEFQAKLTDPHYYKDKNLTIKDIMKIKKKNLQEKVKIEPEQLAPLDKAHSSPMKDKMNVISNNRATVSNTVFNFRKEI